MHEKATTVQPGREVLPGYEVVALLSHGRRIDTYDVYSTERDCRCIVKILRPDRRDEVRVREAVIQEGTLLRHLTHPHLVRGYEVVHKPVPAMVLETLNGATLAALIEDNPLSVSDSATLGLQLASVLGYLHRQGWLHLDVKPANIVVESGRATLIDLSLVGRPGSGRPGAGTRGYLSPEQALGENLSPASDVWGLGVTLLESLTDEMPFGEEATWGSRRRLPLIHRRAPAAPRLAPGLPGAYEDLLRRCLDQRPDARPSLDRVRSSLHDLVDDSTGVSAG
ncbi:MAG TPA: serine/threonine-protein kinase [Nocardioidaceae bacterium]|nr:serine/threonine-protein kinase [Nocardioidaceae bacterium]